MTATLGAFLSEAQDRKAESEGVAYNRARYRALKNLLTGCAQHAGDAPTTVAYYLGFLTAGVTLQATAVGHPMDYADSNLYSGLLRALPKNPEYANALWTGFRHALCREGDRGDAYLLRYWRDHARWEATDERNVAQIAKGVVRFHSNCWETLQSELGAEEAEVEAVAMMDDLYRYITTYLLQGGETRPPGDAAHRIHHRAARRDPAARGAGAARGRALRRPGHRGVRQIPRHAGRGAISGSLAGAVPCIWRIANRTRTGDDFRH